MVLVILFVCYELDNQLHRVDFSSSIHWATIVATSAFALSTEPWLWGCLEEPWTILHPFHIFISSLITSVTNSLPLPDCSISGAPCCRKRGATSELLLMVSCSLWHKGSSSYHDDLGSVVSSYKVDLEWHSWWRGQPDSCCWNCCWWSVLNHQILLSVYGQVDRSREQLSFQPSF